MEGYFVDDVEERCLNCEAALAAKAKYCDQCGQKVTTGRIKLRTLLAEFFETVFNIESKFFRTIAALVIPGKLTTEFFKGRHQTYLRPIRLFFVMAVVHFAIIAFVVDNALEDQIEDMHNGQLSRGFRSQFLAEMDTAQMEITTHFGESQDTRNVLDSMQRRMSKKGPGKLNLEFLDRVDGEYVFDTRSFNFEEAFILPVEEVLKDKEVNSRIGKFFLGRSIRVNRNLNRLLGFVISNLTWMILLMMPALAAILKLLYIRRDYYFVEHLIFSFHYHAFAFLIASPAYLLLELWPPVMGIAFGIIFLYLFLAMKRIYQQGGLKTGIKFLILNNLYLFVIIFFTGLMGLISVLVF
jgi:hypothetical protein